MKNYPTAGNIIISFQSTKHPKVPETKGAVRADTHIAGYIIKPVNHGRDTELFIISQVDVKVKFMVLKAFGNDLDIIVRDRFQKLL